eukprot:Trichotokara_eunicae@DN2415_c0_g1_i1.p1
MVRGAQWGSQEFKISIIGDEDTVAGFLMTGIGMRDGQGKQNFLVVDTKTRRNEIEEAFKNFTTRKDIAILIIQQNIADEIRHLVDTFAEKVPAILEIPSKDKEYDPAKDSILQRVKVFFGGRLPDMSNMN